MYLVYIYVYMYTKRVFAEKVQTLQESNAKPSIREQHTDIHSIIIPALRTVKKSSLVFWICLYIIR